MLKWFDFSSAFVSSVIVTHGHTIFHRENVELILNGEKYGIWLIAKWNFKIGRKKKLGKTRQSTWNIAQKSICERILTITFLMKKSHFIGILSSKPKKVIKMCVHCRLYKQIFDLLFIWKKIVSFFHYLNNLFRFIVTNNASNASPGTGWIATMLQLFIKGKNPERIYSNS